MPVPNVESSAPVLAPESSTGDQGARWTPAFCLRLILLLLAIGVACRVAQYLSARSLWQDEAYVVLNLREKSPAQLLGPLDARPHTPQAAPPAFLLVEKLVFDRWGVRELPLRAFAQVAGLLALALFARLAWQMLGPRPAAVLAVGLFALSRELIAHAAEVKQYSGDAFFTVLLLWLATRDRPTSDDRRRRLWTVTLAASACIWFSYTALFVAAGIGLSMLVARRPRTPRELAAFALAFVPLLISAVTLYVVCVRHQQVANLYDEWGTHLANWSAPLKVPLWIAVATYGVVDYAAANAGAVLLPLAIVGAAVLWRTKGPGRPTAVLLVAPVALCLAAALVGRYPYGGERTSAFLIPAVCLLAGAGFGALLASGRRPVRLTAGALTAAAAAFLVFQCGQDLIRPRTRSHIRPAIAYVSEHRRPTDHVWVVGGAPSSIYGCYVHPVDGLTTLDVPRKEFPPLPPGRTWVVFAGDPKDLVKDVVNPRLADLRKVATERDAFAVRGGAAYLFEAKP